MRTSEVRAAYVRYMRVFLTTRGMDASTYGSSRLPYDGGSSPYSKPKSPAWPHLAQVLHDLGASASSYMKFHFSRKMIHAPTPYQLASFKAVEEYRQRGLPLEVSDVKYRLSTDVNEFKYWATRNKRLFSDDRLLWRCVLLDVTSGQNISPLFRYLIAMSLDMKEVADQWRPEANLQYLGNRYLYDNIWSKLIRPGYIQVSEEEVGVLDDLSANQAAPPELPASSSSQFKAIRA